MGAKIRSYILITGPKTRDHDPATTPRLTHAARWRDYPVKGARARERGGESLDQLTSPLSRTVSAHSAAQAHNRATGQMPPAGCADQAEEMRSFCNTTPL